MLYVLRLIRVERGPPLVSGAKRQRVILIRYCHDYGGQTVVEVITPLVTLTMYLVEEELARCITYCPSGLGFCARLSLNKKSPALGVVDAV